MNIIYLCVGNVLLNIDKENNMDVSEHKDSCECCQFYIKEIEQQSSRASALISTLQVTVNQLNQKIKYVEDNLYSLDDNLIKSKSV